MTSLHVSYYTENPRGRHVWGDVTLDDSAPPRNSADVEDIRAEVVEHVQRAFPDFRYPGCSVVIVAWNVMP
jgi:hypothetical protein